MRGQFAVGDIVTAFTGDKSALEIINKYVPDDHLAMSIYIAERLEVIETAFVRPDKQYIRVVYEGGEQIRSKTETRVDADVYKPWLPSEAFKPMPPTKVTLRERIEAAIEFLFWKQI